MLKSLATPDQILAVLAETPPRLAALARGHPPAVLRAAPAPGEWPAVAVLAHLRACADVWGEAIATILAQDHPTFRAINPTTWIDHTDYRELEFQPSLDAFARQRDELLAVLRPLPPDAWARAATVTGAGKPLQRTVLSYSEALAAHERPHIKQIARLLQTSEVCGNPQRSHPQ